MKILCTLSFRVDETLGPRLLGDGAEAGDDMVVLSGESNLEDFDVRMLFDKLEDQNLHLASQLARHNEDLQVRICSSPRASPEVLIHLRKWQLDSCSLL